MPVKYNELNDAFTYVSSTARRQNQALLCKQSGQCYWSFDGDFGQWPADAHDPDKYVMVPHKKDLDLGRRQVRDFVRLHLPEQWDSVERIFSRQGAYRRFKDWLSRYDLLDKWLEFEKQSTKEALLAWCQQEGIELIEE